MNQGPVCYFPVSGGIDEYLTQTGFTEYTVEDMASLRGLYEMDNNTPLIPEGANERKLTNQQKLDILNKLSDYIKHKTDLHLKKLKDSTKHPAKSFAQLYQVEGWNETTRRNRINTLSIEFIAEVNRRLDIAESMGLSLTMEQIINGYKANGQYHEGQFAIFEAVFDKLLNKFNKSRKLVDKASKTHPDKLEAMPAKLKEQLELAKHIVEEYPKIFQNWAALCTFSRMSLRDMVGLKLGNTLEYAAPTTPDNFSDTFLEDTYNIEESVKEAWMKIHSQTSSFSSLGTEVRRFLSTIINVDEENNKVKDDLGYFQYMDPLKTHTDLLRILRGCTSESRMIRKLNSLAYTYKTDNNGNRIKEVKDPKMAAIVEALANTAEVDLDTSIDDANKPTNPIILTQLFEDMHKNFIKYSALIRIKSGKIIDKVLNREHNPLRDEFTLRMQLNKGLSPLSIYNNEGKINWENLAKWRKESEYLLPSPKKSEAENANNIFMSQAHYKASDMPFYNTLSEEGRVNYLVEASQALGIAMTKTAARKIVEDEGLRKKYITSLRKFREETAKVNSNAPSELATLEKFGGIKPSLAMNNTAEQINAYTSALEKLNNNSKSYESYITSTYGSTSDKSVGAGMEEINKMLDIVADVSTYLETERSVSWFDRKGKANSRFSDRTPSYMGDLVEKIHSFVDEGDAKGLKDFIMDKWGQSSFFFDKDWVNPKTGEKEGRFLNSWLQEMYDSIHDSRGNITINPEAFAKVFQFEEFLGSNIDNNVSTFENFTEKQHAESMLKHFIGLRDQNKKSGLAKYPCFILGDSGAQMFFTARHYDTVHDKEGINKIINGLKDVFKQEIERRKYVEATNKVLIDGGFKPIDNFSQTADEFTMLTFLNPTFKDGKYWKMLTGEDTIPTIKDSNGKTVIDSKEAMKLAVEAVNTDNLTNTLKAYMEDSISDFKKKLASVGILTATKGANGTITYNDANNFFSGNLSNTYTMEKMVEDFFWNTKYATIQQLQMFTVDPAFYDHRYPVKDLQKRYKEIYAPGKGLSLEARDCLGNLYMTRPYERVVYFDDISVSSEDVNPEFYKVLEKTFGKNSPILNLYTHNTLTDGQGYRTLESYRAVRGMAGEWTNTMERAYQAIQAIRKSGRTLNEGDIKQIAELAVIFQPIKPYLYTLEKLEINSETHDSALIPVQHKYAEIVLIPELLADGKLKDMALWMENHTDEKGNAAPIDMIASTKCVKVGAFGSAQIDNLSRFNDLRNEDGSELTETQKLDKALKQGFIHNLAWADYRIQSGVPEHLNHAQLFGTQIRKLILAGINKSNNYQYLSKIFGKQTDDPRGLSINLPGMGKVYLNGANLISLYNCLVMANLFDSYDKFEKQVGTNKALSDKLLQNVISNSNQSEDNAFGFSLIEDGEFEGELVMPLGEPGIEHDAAALLNSLFKKNVNKQKIKGGSAVQASALGLSGYAEVGDLFEVVSPSGDNVLYDEVEMPFNVSYTSAFGKDVPLRFEDWCNPDGTLKMSDDPNDIVFDEDALEFLSFPVSGRDKYGRPPKEALNEKGFDEQGYHIPLIEKKYPGVLNIIAYRIPTEMEYSMVNCKVFRFTNPLAGGTLKIPSSRTTTGGFDFDIDKLYFFMKEFAQTHLTDKQVDDIWKAIYAQHPKWQRNLEGAKKDAIKRAEDIGDYETAKALEKSKLHTFWESAGIAGKDHEAFTKYLEEHRSEYPVFDTYNPDLSPLNPHKDENGNMVAGNSRVARNNLLIDLMRARLMDPETLKQRYTPGGFAGNSDAALRMRVLRYADKADITTNGSIDWAKVDNYVKRIRDKEIKDPEPEFDVSDPTTILTYNQQNQIADKLIGIFANQNTNHVYSSLLHKFHLTNKIFFGNHYMNGLGDFLKAPEGIDVDVNVAEYLAASVDAVKDPVLNYLNLNLITADAGAMLARIGYTPMEIGLLFTQPIIKELCDYATNNNVSADVAIIEMTKKYGGKNTSLDNIQYQGSEVSTDKLANNILKAEEAAKNGNEYSTEFKNNQLQVLSLFNEILLNASDVNSFVQATRFTAANSVGSTFGDHIAQEQRVNSFIEKYITPKEDKKGDNKYSNKDKNEDKKNKRRLEFELFDPAYLHNERTASPEDAVMTSTNQGILNSDENLLNISHEKYMTQMSRNPLAFEQCMMDLIRKATKRLFRKHFPYYTDKYEQMRSNLARLTKFGTLDADTINSLHREFIVYLLSRQQDSLFDGEGINSSSGKYKSNREYYTEDFPKIIATLKQEGLLSNIPFFDALVYKTNDFGEQSLSVQGMGGLQSSTSNMLTEMWADAFNSEGTVKSNKLGLEFSVKDLARDLFFYNFYKLGFNFHPTVFMNLVPTILKQGLMIDSGKEQISYIDFIRDVIGDGETSRVHLGAFGLMSFTKQYLLNHLDNHKFVFTVKGTARQIVDKALGGHNTFTLSLKDLSNDRKSLFLLNDKTLDNTKVAFRPIIAIENTNEKGKKEVSYYMANNSSFNITDVATGTMTYVQVYPQGTKGKNIQYYSDATLFDMNEKGKSVKMITNEKVEKANRENPLPPLNQQAEDNVNNDNTNIPDTSDDTSGVMFTLTTEFSDAEWERIADELYSRNPAKIEDNRTKQQRGQFVKSLYSSPRNYSSFETLKEIADKVKAGNGELKTIDDKGNETKVC